MKLLPNEIINLAEP